METGEVYVHSETCAKAEDALSEVEQSLGEADGGPEDKSLFKILVFDFDTAVVDVTEDYAGTFEKYTRNDDMHQQIESVRKIALQALEEATKRR